MAMQWKNIFEAAANGDENAVRYFVEVHGISIKSVNEDKQTLAHIAAEYTHLNVLKYVLGKEPSLLTYRDNFNNTVLFHAVVGGFLPMVKYLVDELGADIYERINPSSGNNAIHEAADEGRIEILRYFIEEKRADVNSKNDAGQPPLFIAAAKVHLPIVEYLVEKAYADVTITDFSNNTILDVAVKIGDLSVPRYLLDKRFINLDINRGNSMGRTIVYLASKFNHLAFLKYFVEEKHADVNICDKVGRSPLHIAAHQGHLRMVKYLIKHGADPEIKDTFGKTAKDMSANDEVAQYLDEIMYPPSRRKRSAVLNFVTNPVVRIFSPYEQEYLSLSAHIPISSQKATLPLLGAGSTLQFDHHLLLALVGSRHVQKCKLEHSRKSRPSVQSIPEFLYNRIETMALEVIISSQDPDYAFKMH